MTVKTSVYPGQFDVFLRLRDGIDRVEADHWNIVADAIENIQAELGLNPEGNKSSLELRLAVNINDDGQLIEFIDGVITTQTDIQFSEVFTTAPICFAQGMGDPGPDRPAIMIFQFVATGSQTMDVYKRNGSTPTQSGDVGFVMWGQPTVS